MDSTHVLTTKLYIPPLRVNAITRPRLRDKLLGSVSPPASITLVSGPAGFGKTTLLSEFVTHLHQPAAWVSLDRADNDPLRFWTHLIVACQSSREDFAESALGSLDLFGSPQQLPGDVIPARLINELARQKRSIVLILDDYHEIQNPSIHAGVLFLLDHLPPNLHIVVSTRIDPPWPLARYRARNQLSEIRTPDLYFSSQEAAEFLTHSMGLHLSAEDVAVLEERTEGWIAGLQLAALSLQGCSDVAAFIRGFTGSHVYIAEYLIEEILQQQAEDMQLFLLQTSILEQMNSELCEAVTDCQDSQTRLMALHRANAFILPLDDKGHWFHYHQLFADLLLARLQQNLSAQVIAALHLRASHWYEQHGFVLEAIKHALAATDFGRAAALVAQAGQTVLFTNPQALKNWLDVLPLEQFHLHPCLEVYQALIELSQGTLDMSEETLLEKERLIKVLPSSPEDNRLRREALVFLCSFMAHQNTSRAIQMAKEMLVEIPAGDLKLRAYLFSALYRAYGMEGDIEQATLAYQECFRLAQAAGQYGMLSNTTMVRAFDLCQYGRMDEAVRYCQSIIDAGKRSQPKVFYPAGMAYIGLAGIYLERNDLEPAEDYLKRGLELCHQGGTDGLFTGYVQKARLQQAKGEFEAALAELQRLEQTFRRREFTLVARHVSIRLAIGDISGVSQWVAPLLEILGDSPYAHQLPRIAVEAFKLSLARIYIAQGEIERAGRTLDEIYSTAKPDNRFGRLMEVYLLRALAEQKQRSGSISLAAIAHIERALDLAEPAGFALLLLEEGPALVPLLHAVVDQRAVPDRLKNYARKLLSAFGAGKPAAFRFSSQATGLVEALTPRELEVLQLIAAGDSNLAIAGKLVITVRTVKKHTTNILGKLDAGNRTQAVAHARKLGLIAPD